LNLKLEKQIRKSSGKISLLLLAYPKLLALLIWLVVAIGHHLR